VITNIEVATVTWPVWLLVAALLVTLFIGALAGNFTSGVEAKKKVDEARARAEIASQQARGEIERAAARVAHAEKMASSASSNSLPGRTILRLWLDSAERPSLDLDGQSMDTARISALQQKRLANLLSVMHPWTEGLATESMQAFTPALAPQSATSSGKSPAIKKDEKAAGPVSSVAQINEILRVRLASMPQETRDIWLEESREGGVIVWVDKQKFAGVGDVVDPSVQALLRASIAEWEKKYTPGL
jgi:hypothetical protein